MSDPELNHATHESVAERRTAEAGSRFIPLDGGDRLEEQRRTAPLPECNLLFLFRSPTEDSRGNSRTAPGSDAHIRSSSTNISMVE